MNVIAKVMSLTRERSFGEEWQPFILYFGNDSENSNRNKEQCSRNPAASAHRKRAASLT